MVLVVALGLIALAAGVGYWQAHRLGQERLERLSIVAGLGFAAASLVVSVAGSPFAGSSGSSATSAASPGGTPGVGPASSTAAASTAAEQPALPELDLTIVDDRGVAELAGFLDRTSNRRVKLDVTIEGWAQGGQPEPNASGSGQLLGSIGDPGCAPHGLQRDTTDCYGFDVFVVGQKAADLESGFWWLGHDRWTLRGVFFNLGGSSQVGTEWGLQVVRTPSVG